MIDLNDNSLPENIVPWGSALLNWTFAQPETYEEGYTPWEKYFDRLLEKFHLAEDPTKLTFALIILLKMYFVELKFDEEESENEEEKIAYLIAKHDWNGCKEMGEGAIKKAIESLVDPIYVLEGNWYSREIVEAVNSFGKEKVVEILKGITNSWDWDGDQSIEVLESMIQNY